MTGTVHGPEPINGKTPGLDDPEMPELGDRYDRDLLVALAYRSMYTYAGGRLTRNDADVLLGFWRNYNRLTEGQIRAILNRFSHGE